MCGRTRVYHERQVNEHALRVARSEVKWAVIISTISYGKRNVDSRILGILGRALPSRRLTIALPRYQMIILMRSEALNSSQCKQCKGQSRPWVTTKDAYSTTGTRGPLSDPHLRSFGTSRKRRHSLMSIRDIDHHGRNGLPVSHEGYSILLSARKSPNAQISLSLSTTSLENTIGFKSPVDLSLPPRFATNALTFNTPPGPQVVSRGHIRGKTENCRISSGVLPNQCASAR